MIKISINGRELIARKGQKLIEVAEQNGIIIPAMCRNEELEHFTSCMVCLVKDLSSGKLIPSCSVDVGESMQVLTDDEEVVEARKIALALLLSEHVGDCEAPCRIACPALMNIPLMNRLIAAGNTQGALEVVMEDIVLPGVLGRICPAPCEGACKRKPIDEAVSICLLKRFAADQCFPVPHKKGTALTGKMVAIIGAGPAGLAAAWHLQQKGIQATVFDKNEYPGGSLRYAIPDDKLDKGILDREVRFIQDSGVQFSMGESIDEKAFKTLRQGYDAVVIATGNYADKMDSWGLQNNSKQVLVNKNSYLTNLDRVFAIGNVNRSMQLAVRSLAQGKEVAVAVQQLLAGIPVSGQPRRFNSTIGKLQPSEYAEYLKEGSNDVRAVPAKDSQGGFSPDQARTEAARCLHCDCRKPNSCKLRNYAEEYSIEKKRFLFTERNPVKKFIQPGQVVFEPGKCIKCGICVRLTAKYEERFGFTFIGRGFDVHIGIPFDNELSTALEKTAQKVADACPTGALSNHQTRL